MTVLAFLMGVFVLAALAPWITRPLGRAAGWVFALLPAAFAVMLGTLAPQVAAGTPVRETLEWVPQLGLSLTLSVDGLGLLFGMLITGVGALVLVYAQGYLEGHEHLGRMFSYLLMFMGAMLGVVLTDNLLAMFVFWELTSISSYLLIGFDHNRLKARKAALQALLITGGGGLALLVGVLMLGSLAGTYNVSEMLAGKEGVLASDLYVPIAALFALGAFTKSAQFPFHFWLPGAMEAPTPVSAYLHSSTMVKAGIYLLARLSPVLGGTELWETMLTVAGATTMVLGAVLAIRQTYLKKLLAYSTVSSLGIIVMGLGIGTPYAVEAAIVYLFAHALFKGALFMVAGAIDHGTGERDVERLGGLARAMPALAVVGVLAALSMAGLPPLMGFIGKELLLKGTLKAPEWSGVLTGLTVFTALLTVTIALLTGIKPFIGKTLPTPHEPHAPGPALLLGPGLLALLCVATALVPSVLAMPLVGPASAATLGAPSTPDLSLWHGWTLALGLSALAVAGGCGVYALRGAVRRGVEVFGWIDRVGPASAYEIGLKGLNALASGQTRVLQNGYLRSYLFITISTAAGMVGVTLWLRGGLNLPERWEPALWYEYAIGALIAVAAVVAAVARARLTAIAALGLAGYGVSVMFVVFGAPDLAMTQISIETLTVILFVLVLLRLPDFRSISSRTQKIRDLFIAVTAGAMMTVLVLVASGATSSRAMSTWFGENSLEGGHGRNVVNVILVDFRAIDTLGEITVLAIAAIGVFALLRPSRMLRKGRA
ncbi:MAG: putative monovalent cation/H+ antiporter subunit A [Phycisphaeraceae bacterium]|nr:putative monovalent cation/H+ antiporter subunit A [Phycisphaeraceae bacterium]MBX3410268.1 putative monovalent cation/H+ antiporter subunit A [Phycisphaeraceae bacterium]